ncbi:hypothetical protein [Paraflavitalea pollutisoli]|uniref:hypothetical protein n=1 Tax=Paraflavitalea pollutisoli TaxID=3034143 RepID=UPI0023EBBDB7|nr:hypothetical protein [Paraflavitalea sp. H1-2-19X]
MVNDFDDLIALEAAGFTGFKTYQELFFDSSCISRKKGVYLIVGRGNKMSFLPKGTGGFFKGKDPNVALPFLHEKWVEGAKVLYIGKAGSSTGKATLHSRLNQYFKFGQGRNVGHWGGRLVWQIEGARELVVCWKTLSDLEPRKVEQDLIKAFVRQFDKRPFANLAD